MYRTLQQMAEIGAIDTLHDETGETLYRSCVMDDHHHHLVCTNCRKTVEIDGGAVEAWAKDIAAKHGFQKSGHTAEVLAYAHSVNRPSSTYLGLDRHVK